ncbi:carbohydrate kinase [bacterium]|nr:carbohydrate kinase [bacterium]
MNYKVAVFGEVLWDIIEGKEYIGGAPFNLACHLKKLGVDVIFISAVGNDERGKKVFEVMEKYGIGKEFRKVEGIPTGVVDVEIKEEGPSYTIRYPSAWDYIKLSPDKIEKLREEKVKIFCFGTLALRSEVSYKTFLSLLSFLNDCEKFCDINLRKPFYTEDKIKICLQHTDILKLNEEELMILKKIFNFHGRREEIMRRISEKFNIKMVCTTLGENGAVLLKNGAIFSVPGIKVDVVDTVGAGDAFSAGFIKAYLDGFGGKEILNFANKLGAFVASKRSALP